MFCHLVDCWSAWTIVLTAAVVSVGITYSLNMSIWHSKIFAFMQDNYLIQIHSEELKSNSVWVLQNLQYT